MLFEVAEDAPRHVDRHARDADHPASEGRLGAHPLGHRERPAHAPPEAPAQRAGRERGVVRGLHLAEDLRLSQDHRVEARRDPEDVTHGLLTPLLVEVLGDRVAPGRTTVKGELVADRGDGLLDPAVGLPVWRAVGPMGHRHDLDAVARAEEHRLGQLGPRDEAREQRRHRVGRAGEALAHLDGRGAVGEADDDDHACRPEAMTLRTR